MSKKLARINWIRLYQHKLIGWIEKTPAPDQDGGSVWSGSCLCHWITSDSPGPESRLCCTNAVLLEGGTPEAPAPVVIVPTPGRVDWKPRRFRMVVQEQARSECDGQRSVQGKSRTSEDELEEVFEPDSPFLGSP
ncbi:hypothetical protein CPT_Piffle_096 [Stenotrophomonas phage Piffle]|uniref:Uncharacterized protein n=1 Tax=Stenotrophomonas phage Piffle TaxID=2859656 RepID=A0AAE7WM40_9CAUD|nr:hypothetical protein PP762_gp36 [Stenotrophomonas phage Piffle]QYW01950.1 hypothetical protein CPT_Piffle_096 [Stenotrophomonas phage Piffle]